MDCLRYPGTVYAVCTRGLSRRQIHDLTRMTAVYGKRIHVCACVADPWAKATLSFLGAVWTPATQQCNISST